MQAAPRSTVSLVGKFGTAKFWAVLIAFAGGLGSGAGAVLYTDLKTKIGAYFAEKPERLYIKELTGACGANQQPDFSKTDIYPHSLAASKVGSTWSGTITEDGKSSIKYNVSGYRNGNYLSLSWISATGAPGVGNYFLHRDTNQGDDYYEGYAIGRDCSGQTEQTVKCPVILTDNTDIVEIKRKPFLQKPCTQGE